MVEPWSKMSYFGRPQGEIPTWLWDNYLCQELLYKPRLELIILC